MSTPSGRTDVVTKVWKRAVVLGTGAWVIPPAGRNGPCRDEPRLVAEGRGRVDDAPTSCIPGHAGLGVPLALSAFGVVVSTGPRGAGEAAEAEPVHGALEAIGRDSSQRKRTEGRWRLHGCTRRASAAARRPLAAAQRFRCSPLRVRSDYHPNHRDSPQIRRRHGSRPRTRLLPRCAGPARGADATGLQCRDRLVSNRRSADAPVARRARRSTHPATHRASCGGCPSCQAGTGGPRASCGGGHTDPRSRSLLYGRSGWQPHRNHAMGQHVAGAGAPTGPQAPAPAVRSPQPWRPGCGRVLRAAVLRACPCAFPSARSRVGG